MKHFPSFAVPFPCNEGGIVLPITCQCSIPYVAMTAYYAPFDRWEWCCTNGTNLSGLYQKGVCAASDISAQLLFVISTVL